MTGQKQTLAGTLCLRLCFCCPISLTPSARFPPLWPLSSALLSSPCAHSLSSVPLLTSAACLSSPCELQTPVLQGTCLLGHHTHPHVGQVQCRPFFCLSSPRPLLSVTHQHPLHSPGQEPRPGFQVSCPVYHKPCRLLFRSMLFLNNFTHSSFLCIRRGADSAGSHCLLVNKDRCPADAAHPCFSHLFPAPASCS